MDNRSTAAARRTYRRGPFTVHKGGKDQTDTVVDFYDYNLLAGVILLSAFGLVMLYSTSAYEASVNYESDTYFFAKQAVITVASLIGVLIVSQLDYHLLKPVSGFIYFISMLLLVLTRYIGTTVNGARRWIYLGPISFQPAEFAKLAVIIFLPVLIEKAGKNFRGWKVPTKIGAWGMLAAFLTYYFTDNLSTGLIIAGITIALIIIVHPNPTKLLGLMGIGFVLIVLAVIYLRNFADLTATSGSFRINRILVWLNPDENADAGGYQVMQALYAIGSGGLFGKGLGNSTQKLGAVPEAQNDMIFSIICEELGVFGAGLLIILFVFLLWRLAVIAQNAPDLYGSLIAIGIFSHISLQVILNIAVVTNTIPTTGITLPFVSYGGTSVLFLMAEMALALSVSKQIKAH